MITSRNLKSRGARRAARLREIGPNVAARRAGLTKREGGPSVSEENKAMIGRMVDGINAGEIESTVDGLFAPPAGRSLVLRYLY